jgi:hypothetical protein
MKDKNNIIKCRYEDTCEFGLPEIKNPCKRCLNKKISNYGWYKRRKECKTF